MSWFDEQPQPQQRIGITDPGQGQNRFLPGDQIGPDGMPTNGQWPGQPMPFPMQNGPYQDLDMTRSGPDHGYEIHGDGSAWAITIGGPIQISPPGVYGRDGKVLANQPAGSQPPTSPIGQMAPYGQTQPQSGQSNGNYQQTYQQIMGGANDQASLLAHQAELEAAGFHLSPANASGAISKIQTPDGQWVRVIGEGEGHPVWIPQGGAGTIGSLSGSGGMADGSLIQPWNEQFQAPSPEQIQSDPSYQFQLGQGLQGVERGAASKGTLLTGGTIKALNNYGQGLASTFSDKYYNRALGEYGLKKQNFQENQDRPFTKLSQLATLGKPQTMQPPTG